MDVNGQDVAVYIARTGALVSYTTRWGNIYTAEQIGAYLRVNRDSAGDLLQIWNLWDGLLNIEAVTADGYTIALYTPSQITGQDEQGLYTVMGEPFKKFVMAGDAATGRFSVTEQTPGRLDFKTEWWLNGKAWNMAQGTDAEAIVTRPHADGTGERYLAARYGGFQGRRRSCRLPCLRSVPDDGLWRPASYQSGWLWQRSCTDDHL